MPPSRLTTLLCLLTPLLAVSGFFREFRGSAKFPPGCQEGADAVVVVCQADGRQLINWLASALAVRTEVKLILMKSKQNLCTCQYLRLVRRLRYYDVITWTSWQCEWTNFKTCTSTAKAALKMPMQSMALVGGLLLSWKSSKRSWAIRHHMRYLWDKVKDAKETKTRRMMYRGLLREMERVLLNANVTSEAGLDKIMTGYVSRAVRDTRADRSARFKPDTHYYGNHKNPRNAELFTHTLVDTSRKRRDSSSSPITMPSGINDKRLNYLKKCKDISDGSDVKNTSHFDDSNANDAPKEEGSACSVVQRKLQAAQAQRFDLKQYTHPYRLSSFGRNGLVTINKSYPSHPPLSETKTLSREKRKGAFRRFQAQQAAARQNEAKRRFYIQKNKAKKQKPRPKIRKEKVNRRRQREKQFAFYPMPSKIFIGGEFLSLFDSFRIEVAASRDVPLRLSKRVEQIVDEEDALAKQPPRQPTTKAVTVSYLDMLAQAILDEDDAIDETGTDSETVTAQVKPRIYRIIGQSPSWNQSATTTATRKKAKTTGAALVVAQNDQAKDHRIKSLVVFFVGIIGIISVIIALLVVSMKEKARCAEDDYRPVSRKPSGFGPGMHMSNRALHRRTQELWPLAMDQKQVEKLKKLQQDEVRMAASNPTIPVYMGVEVEVQPQASFTVPKTSTPGDRDMRINISEAKPKEDKISTPPTSRLPPYLGGKHIYVDFAADNGERPRSSFQSQAALVFPDNTNVNKLPDGDKNNKQPKLVSFLDSIHNEKDGVIRSDHRNGTTTSTTTLPGERESTHHLPGIEIKCSKPTYGPVFNRNWDNFVNGFNDYPYTNFNMTANNPLFNHELAQDCDICDMGRPDEGTSYDLSRTSRPFLINNINNQSNGNLQSSNNHSALAPRNGNGFTATKHGYQSRRHHGKRRLSHSSMDQQRTGVSRLLGSSALGLSTNGIRIERLDENNNADEQPATPKEDKEEFHDALTSLEPLSPVKKPSNLELEANASDSEEIEEDKIKEVIPGDQTGSNTSVELESEGESIREKQQKISLNKKEDDNQQEKTSNEKDENILDQLQTNEDKRYQEEEGDTPQENKKIGEKTVGKEEDETAQEKDVKSQDLKEDKISKEKEDSGKSQEEDKTPVEKKDGETSQDKEEDKAPDEKEVHDKSQDKNKDEKPGVKEDDQMSQDKAENEEPEKMEKNEKSQDKDVNEALKTMEKNEKSQDKDENEAFKTMEKNEKSQDKDENETLKTMEKNEKSQGKDEDDTHEEKDKADMSGRDTDEKLEERGTDERSEKSASEKLGDREEIFKQQEERRENEKMMAEKERLAEERKKRALLRTMLGMTKEEEELWKSSDKNKIEKLVKPRDDPGRPMQEALAAIRKPAPVRGGENPQSGLQKSGASSTSISSPPPSLLPFQNEVTTADDQIIEEREPEWEERTQVSSEIPRLPNILRKSGDFSNLRKSTTLKDSGVSGIITDDIEVPWIVNSKRDLSLKRYTCLGLVMGSQGLPEKPIIVTRVTKPQLHSRPVLTPVPPERDDTRLEHSAFNAQKRGAPLTFDDLAPKLSPFPKTIPARAGQLPPPMHDGVVWPQAWAKTPPYASPGYRRSGAKQPIDVNPFLSSPGTVQIAKVPSDPSTAIINGKKTMLPTWISPLYRSYGIGGPFGPHGPFFEPPFMSEDGPPSPQPEPEKPEKQLCRLSRWIRALKESRLKPKETIPDQVSVVEGQLAEIKQIVTEDESKPETVSSVEKSLASLLDNLKKPETLPSSK